MIAALVRMEDKINRLQYLIADNGAKHADAIADTLDDLANYAIMTRMELGK